MESTIIKNTMKIGDKVMFDKDKIDLFKTETSGDDPAIKQYQKLVLAGVDQVGVIKEFLDNLATISYPDGWDLPVPIKHLIVVSE